MKKIKTNLKMVAAIVACFAASMFFFSCNDPDDNGGNNNGNNGNTNKIDKELIGKWFATTGYWDTGLVFHDYYFYKDGTFKYTRVKLWPTYIFEGKYTTKNGKIYFTNIYRHDKYEDGRETDKELIENRDYDYLIKKEDNKTYLSTTTFEIGGTWGDGYEVKFQKSDEPLK